MNHCVSCGYQVPSEIAICPHHHADDPGWARTNRVMCDLLHRGIVPRRLRPRDREDELIGRAEVATAA
jgi:hypothetical protein